MNRRDVMRGFGAMLAAPLAGCAPPAVSSELVPIVAGLDHPWGMAFLPDGHVLVTEREGRLRLIDVATGKLGDPISGLPEISAGGQGGLLGIAIDPDFASNRQVYLSFSQAFESGRRLAVFRAALSGDGARLENGRVIFGQNRVYSGGQHFGSRLVFDRSQHLFVTTGDRGGLRDAVQDPASHIGKVLRITRDGSPVPDNPRLAGWAPEVWSMGHRNIQGAVLHPDTGTLWTVEHGPRGGDELNQPQAGKNYGWPVISYGREYSMLSVGDGTAKSGMEQPVHYWDPSIAPSGLAVCTSPLYPKWKGSFMVGALVGQHVARLTMVDGKMVEEQLFKDVARFRDVAQGPDGHIYLLTDESTPSGALLRIKAHVSV